MAATERQSMLEKLLEDQAIKDVCQRIVGVSYEELTDGMDEASVRSLRSLESDQIRASIKRGWDRLAPNTQEYVVEKLGISDPNAAAGRRADDASEGHALFRRLSRLQSTANRTSDRLSAIERNSKSPSKRTGNPSIEHVVFQFFDEYLVTPDVVVDPYPELWQEEWKQEKEMYDPLVIELNKHAPPGKYPSWFRTDTITMKQRFLKRCHIAFFEERLGINMEEINLKLPDLSLLYGEDTCEKRREDGEKKTKAELIRDRNYGIGFEVKRPFRMIRKIRADKEKEKRNVRPKRKKRKRSNPNADEKPVAKRQRLECNPVETGYFAKVSENALQYMAVDVKLLKKVNMGRSDNDNVHATESWRQVTHQVATLACVCPELPAIVVLSDLDPLCCSYVFWLSTLRKDNDNAPVMCMARIRYNDLSSFVRKLRKSNRLDMFPLCAKPYSLDEFGPTEYVHAETFIDWGFYWRMLQCLSFGLGVLCLQEF